MSYSEILALRIKHKISQIKLAEHSGFTPAMISGWELKKTEPSPEQVFVLAETISDILTRQEETGHDIRKKRIQHSGKTKGETPSIILSAADYVNRMNSVEYRPTEYNMLINSLPAYISPDVVKPKAIALFSGCGGMTLGFKWANFDVLGHVEIDKAANDIYAANFPNSKLLGTDITQIPDSEAYKWNELLGGIDIIIGGSLS